MNLSVDSRYQHCASFETAASRLSQDEVFLAHDHPVGERIASSMMTLDVQTRSKMRTCRAIRCCSVLCCSVLPTPRTRGVRGIITELVMDPARRLIGCCRGPISVAANAPLRHFRQDVILGAIRKAGRLIDERDG